MTIKTTLKHFLTSLLLTLSGFCAFSQNDYDPEEKHKTSVMLGVSGLRYTGYIGSHTSANPLLDARLGYFLAVEQRFGKILGVELSGTYGKLAGTDNRVSGSDYFFSNFESKIIQGQLMLSASFDGLIKNDNNAAPFIKAGIGFMSFSSSTDIKTGNDTVYHYPDGSLHNSMGQSIKRDYTYETTLKTNNQTGCLVVPTMVGFNFHFGRRFSSMFGVGYTFCMSNWIDGSGKGSAGYVNASVGLRYEFKKGSSDAANANYANVDFASVDHLDADKDGVPDDKDLCHGTPKGIKVDEKGCPLDGDADGVPDYMDKEPTTAKGNKVDGFGVTINEADLAQRQKDWDSFAPERSKEFNVAPSMEYLKKVEAESKKANAGKYNASKIPADLRSADINKDGYISADEITKTIDAFFEGESDFTVERINKLIDYFFEQ